MEFLGNPEIIKIILISVISSKKSKIFVPNCRIPLQLTPQYSSSDEISNIVFKQFNFFCDVS